MRQQLDVVTLQQPGQGGGRQGAVGIVGLVEIMHLVALAARHAHALCIGAFFRQPLGREHALGDRGHQQAFDRHGWASVVVSAGQLPARWFFLHFAIH